MAGPQDLEMLFDVFLSSVRQQKENKELMIPVKDQIQHAFKFEPLVSPRDKKPKKVMILGSGGLSIGQAGEFDYSGSQVCYKLCNIYSICKVTKVMIVVTLLPWCQQLSLLQKGAKK